MATLVLKLLIFLVILSSGEPSCHGRLRPKRSDVPSHDWKICLDRDKQNLHFKIVGLFNIKDTYSGWITVGLPKDDAKKNINFFQIIKRGKSKSIELKQKQSKEMNCTHLPRKKKPSVVFVNCQFSNAKLSYLNSKQLTIFYSSGNIPSDNLKKVQTDLIKHHDVLLFYINQPKVEDNAGSAAMKPLRNYGKSMAAIVGISFLLTTMISVTICCCCKKEKLLVPSKDKDVSVSFYKDNGEIEGESDDSNDDEKVAFIRNNNSRNSNV